MSKYFVAMALLPLVSFSAKADTTCQIVDQVRCLCDAGLIVMCDGVSGSHLKNNEKVENLNLHYIAADGTARDIQIKNPANGAASYFGSGEQLLKQSDVQAALKQNNIPVDDILSKKADLRAIGFSIGPNVKLYANPNTQSKEKAETVEVKTDGCSYLSPARALKYKGRDACASYFECGGKLGESVCIAKGNVCPSADTCAGDNSISFDDGDTEIRKITCMDYSSPSDKKAIPHCQPRGVLATAPGGTSNSGGTEQEPGGYN